MIRSATEFGANAGCGGMLLAARWNARPNAPAMNPALRSPLFIEGLRPTGKAPTQRRVLPAVGAGSHAWLTNEGRDSGCRTRATDEAKAARCMSHALHCALLRDVGNTVELKEVS